MNVALQVVWCAELSWIVEQKCKDLVLGEFPIHGEDRLDGG